MVELLLLAKLYHMIIYLDWNSYGIIHPMVSDTMRFVAENYGNPSSKHSLGQKSKRFLLELTANLLLALDAQDYEVFFTASASEANRLVCQMYPSVYVSDIEHPSLRSLPKVKIVKVNNKAELDLSFLHDNLHDKENFIVSYMLANHETGIINDVKSVIKEVKKFNGITHVDMTQAFGRIDISLKTLSPDYATIAAHKAGGPIGIAALLCKKGVPIPQIMYIDEVVGHKNTAPLPLIAGLVEALKIPRSSNSALEELLDPDTIVGLNLSRLPNTTCVISKNHTLAMMELDLAGIYCSTGAACATEDRAHSTYAMGINSHTIRFSSGWNVSLAKLRNVAEIYKSINC